MGTPARSYQSEQKDIEDYAELCYLNDAWNDFDLKDHSLEWKWPVQIKRENEGIQRLQKAKDLAEFGFCRKGKDALLPNAFHQKMDQVMAQTLAPFLVGDDWAESSEKICRAEQWTPGAFAGAAICAPRQVGKSTNMCKWAAIMAEVMPGCIQSIFSTGKRASRHDLFLLYKFICMRGLHDSVECFNQEQLWIRFGPRGDPRTLISKISAFPSNPTISISFFLFFFFKREGPLFFQKKISFFFFLSFLSSLFFYRAK